MNAIFSFFGVWRSFRYEVMNMKKRWIYLSLFAAGLIAEILIGKYVHDSFVRPYVGDMLVVMVVYCLVRTVFPEKIKLLPLYVFLFAAAVEVLQGAGLARIPFIAQRPLLKVIFGSVFDWKDVACYAAGCAAVWGIEALIKGIKGKRNTVD